MIGKEAGQAGSARRPGIPGRVGILFPALALLASCAAPQAEMAERARTELVGLPVSDLYACAGVPETTVEAGGGTRQLVYTRSQTIVNREVDYEEEPFLSRLGPRFVRPQVSYHRLDYACQATVTVADGTVRGIAYNAGRDIQLCYAIVANCMPPAR